MTHVIRTLIAVVLLAGFVATSARVEAMPVPQLATTASDNPSIAKVWWGWRRPWGWGYGWRRPYAYRPWGWGYRRWGWGYRPWGWGYRPWAYRPWVYGRPWIARRGPPFGTAYYLRGRLVGSPAR